MKKNWRIILLMLWLILGLFLLNGCLTAWVTDVKQTRGRFYGALPAQEAVRLEKKIIQNDFERGHFENTLEKERMLNSYVKQQLETKKQGIPTTTEASPGLGFTGIVKNLSPYYKYQFVITSLDAQGLGNSYFLNSQEELMPRLLPGAYDCAVYKDGVKWGSSSRFRVDGRKAYFLGKEVYWYCARE